MHEPAVRADATLTLVLPKLGLFSPAAREHAGRLYLADIGVPQGACRCLGIDVPPLFGSRTWLRLSPAARAQITAVAAGVEPQDRRKYL